MGDNPDPDGQSEHHFPGQIDTPLDITERHERAEVVRDILKHMPQKYATVLGLCGVDELSSMEVSRQTGQNAQTVRWRLHTARQKFREAYAHYDRVADL